MTPVPDSKFWKKHRRPWAIMNHPDDQSRVCVCVCVPKNEQMAEN